MLIRFVDVNEMTALAFEGRASVCSKQSVASCIPAGTPGLLLVKKIGGEVAKGSNPRGGPVSADKLLFVGVKWVYGVGNRSPKHCNRLQV